ncbi:hypothetical protein PCS8203_02002 [Streptococcus pneumoniae PCS8203]|nr:hypothetical protein PCS8203_02002 [Streptococcus pneumoniae PCS8203]ELU55448.1 hypothetical protein PCS8106_01996 [Streptococcus pneumoniae PCS8106]
MNKLIAEFKPISNNVLENSADYSRFNPLYSILFAYFERNNLYTKLLCL